MKIHFLVSRNQIVHEYLTASCKLNSTHVLCIFNGTFPTLSVSHRCILCQLERFCVTIIMFKTTQYTYSKNREHCGFDANSAECITLHPFSDQHEMVQNCSMNWYQWCGIGAKHQSTFRNTFQTTKGNHMMRWLFSLTYKPFYLLLTPRVTSQ